MDLIQLTLSLIVILHDVFGVRVFEMSTIKLIAVFADFLILIKVLDSLRAFKVYSFYVKLIVETVKDMSEFIVILFLAILCSTIMLQIIIG